MNMMTTPNAHTEAAVSFMDFRLYLVGLTGRAGTGKATAADYLRRQRGYLAMSFEDPARRMVESMMRDGGAPLSYARRHELKDLPIPGVGQSWRTLMQTLRVEWAQHLHPDIWVRMAEARLQRERQYWPPTARVVISDVRLPNEASLIRRHGGILLRLRRQDAGPTSLHDSEQHCDALAVDAEIDNDGSPDDLGAQLDAALRLFMAGPSAADAQGREQ